MEKSSRISRTSTQEPFVIEPTSAHTHTFILLHGLGSNGEKFGAELLESGISSSGAKLTEVFPGAKFIFPTARKRRSSAFRRATINQWFDIASLDDVYKRQDVQFQGLAESSQDIQAILNRELEMIPRKDIVLGGLSQGCAMALMVLLSLEFPLGGFIGMSGWLPFCRDLDDIMNPISVEIGGESSDVFALEGDEDQNVDPFIMAINFARDIVSLDEVSSLTSVDEQTCLATPVMLCHGEEDEKVKFKLGEEAARTLSLLGMQVNWKGYSGLGHWYRIPEEIDDILEFLNMKVGWV